MIDMNLEAVNSALAATVRKQEEEIKVLRAALEEIAGHVSNPGKWEATVMARIIERVDDTARSALTAQPAEGEK